MRVGPGNREGALTLRIKSGCERTDRHVRAEIWQGNGKVNDRPGGKRTISNGEPIYYSFTMSPVQCADDMRRRILAECVRHAAPVLFAGSDRPLHAIIFREKPLISRPRCQRFLNA